jgi:hypothetical protein
MKSVIHFLSVMLALGGGISMAQQKTNTLALARRDAYWAHEPQDVATQLLAKVAAKTVRLSSNNQESLTRSLLAALDVPASSQMLVFSGTASQGSRVNAHNPRGLYFNDEVYIGMVPGGFVEMIGIDPKFGGVFYSFEKMKSGSSPTPERPKDCMRCHATTASYWMPGMIARSVVAFTTGGAPHENIDRQIAGHELPLSQRFGGWLVSSVKPIGPTKEGLIAEKKSGGARVDHIELGQGYQVSKYPARTSDILAHLLHEHQMGFVNRMTNLHCIARETEASITSAPPASGSALERVEREVVRYVFFANEAELPAGGIVGNPVYVKDFTQNRRPAKTGIALKDLDLSTRLFKNRCSYMIYTAQWQQMPENIKAHIYKRMKAALTGQDPEFAYLAADERRNIVTILRDTITDLPADWR